MKNNLVVRVDADSRMGTGHLMRTIALGQAWNDRGGKTAFITTCRNRNLLARLRENAFDIHPVHRTGSDTADWHRTMEILKAYPDAWFVLDGYHFGQNYQKQVKKAEYRLLVVDDLAHLKHYYADIILNQNLHAGQLSYSCEKYTHLLLGAKYILLRQEFLKWRRGKRTMSAVAKRVLVTIGGGDSRNNTASIVQALQKIDIPDIEVTVLIGPSNPHVRVLSGITKQSRVPVHLVEDARNVPELMTSADMAISGAGTTIWELLYLGTPTIALVLEDNQSYTGDQLLKRNLCKVSNARRKVSVDILTKEIDSLAINRELRLSCSKRGRRLIDGQGALRVVDAMKTIGKPAIRLRVVSVDDCRLIWEWANESVVREMSFSTDRISWEEHVKWFQNQINDRLCHFYIATVEVKSSIAPIGQVRFMTESDHAEISVSISSAFRGCGYGAEVISLASELLFLKTLARRIYARIKPNNIVSIRAFSRAGYRQVEALVGTEQQVIQMVLERNDAQTPTQHY